MKEFCVAEQHTRVAIDGPAGSGKSTVARLLAQRLGFLYIDTGALYRAATVGCLLQGIQDEGEEEIAAAVGSMNIELRNGVPYLDGRDVSEEIRRPSLTEQVTKLVASNLRVREMMTEAARKAASGRSIVADGRDVAKRIFSEAQIKIYLDADETERAKRRHKELLEKGEKVSYEEVLAAIQARDKDDFSRSYDALEKVPGAQVVDTTGLTIEQVVDRLEQLVKDKIGK
jgi:cytidylate kinase